VTELTQPLAAATTEQATKGSEAAHPAATFSQLVYAHFDWWRAYRQDALDASTAAAYHDALAQFEHRYGEIVSAYWCSHVESAVALTQKKRVFRWAHPGLEVPP